MRVTTGLSLHAGYRCRDSGVCCTSGWAIPVEATVYRTLTSALDRGALRLPRETRTAAFVDADLPPEYARVLGLHADGACVFYDAAHRRCAIHSSLGAHAKPTSCRAFPQLLVIDPRGASRSLSHYCPSAADLLFDDRPIALTPSARAEDDEAIEGLDAREALPPELRADALVDWNSLSAWEHFVMAVLDAAPSPGVALDRLWAACDRLRAWRAVDGPLVSLVERLDPRDAVASRPRFTDEALIAAVWSAIPAHLQPAPLAPIAQSASPAVGVDERTSNRVLCRYLAARAHACWPLYHGQGLRTQLVYLEAVLACVRAQPSLRESIRRTDLWVIHLAAPGPLAQALDALTAKV